MLKINNYIANLRYIKHIKNKQKITVLVYLCINRIELMCNNSTLIKLLMLIEKLKIKAYNNILIEEG